MAFIFGGQQKDLQIQVCPFLSNCGLLDSLLGKYCFTISSSLQCFSWPARRAFYQKHQIVEPRLNPGGWSSHGQPVDQIHGHYRSLLRTCDIKGVTSSLDLRKRPRPLATMITVVVINGVRMMYYDVV